MRFPLFHSESGILRSALVFTALLAALLPGLAHAQWTLRPVSSNTTDIYDGAMQASDGNFYSTSIILARVAIPVTCPDGSSACSYITKIAPDGTATIFHTFLQPDMQNNVDGMSPNPIIEASDGNFYGSCLTGGTDDIGTIFKITPDGVFSVLFTFTQPFVSGVGQTVPNGAFPGALIEGSDGFLYGTTQSDGPATPNGDGAGTIFKISKTGELTTLHSFVNSRAGVSTFYPDGLTPISLIQGADGKFYGTTLGSPRDASGNFTGNGTIFSMTADGTLTTLHNFAADGSEGIQPFGPLTQGSDAAFYSTTRAYGYFGTPDASILTQLTNYVTNGSAYRITPGASFQVLHTFNGLAEGRDPSPYFTLGSDGNFYGAARYAGNSTGCPQTYGCGVLFQMQPAGNLAVIYSFLGGADSGIPYGPIVQANDGSFYGTNEFALSPTTGVPGTFFNLALSPALKGPIQMTFSPTTADPNQPVQLTWNVLNAFSTTAQQCHASILNSATGASRGAGTWTGPQTGQVTATGYSGSATITPTIAGTYTYVLSCGGHETGSATLTVGNGPVITTPSLPAGAVGKPYSAFVQTTGGTSPYQYAATGTLPPGLTIDANAGVISGTPKQFGSFTFGVYVQDSGTPPLSNSAAFTINVASTLALSSTLPNPSLSAAYQATLLATGGLPPYKFALVTGKLPDGLTLNSTTGVVSGMATTGGKFTFTLSVSDSETTPAYITQDFTVSTIVPPLALSPAHIDCTVQVECDGGLQATGGTPPYTFTVVPVAGNQVFENFPIGLTLASAGSYSGLPKQAGSGFATIQVTDSETPAVSANGSVGFGIDSGLQVVSITLPEATVGFPYVSPPAVATGGLPPYTWEVTAPQTVIAEFGFYSESGVLHSPGPVTPGVFTLHYRLTDAEGIPAYVETPATLTVVLPPITSTTTLTTSNPTAGTGMNVTLKASVASSPSTPTGMVTFMNGAASIGTATLDNTGSASLTTSFSSPGAYSLTAVYSGGGNITGSVSTPLVETVLNPTVSASLAPGTLTLTSGQSGTLLLTLTPNNGFTGTVTFSCGQLPAHVSCTFTPPSLTIAAGATSLTDTLTVDTAASLTGSLRLPRSETGNGIMAALTLWFPASTLVFFGLRRKRAPLPRLLGLLLLTCSLAGGLTLTGCGSTSLNPTAAPGTYSIPVTLTLAGGATQAVTALIIVK